LLFLLLLFKIKVKEYSKSYMKMEDFPLKTVSYVLVNVSDMERSVHFYRDQLGLDLRFATKEWTEFDSGPTTLALHIADPKQKAAGSAGEHTPGTCTFSFTVDNLEEQVKVLQQRSVQFIMPPTLREEGIKLAVCLDPDGLAISITELPKQHR
jgi:lactoylglutathione lyase